MQLIAQINDYNQELITNKNKLFNDIKKLNELKETKIFDVQQINTEVQESYTEENINDFLKCNEEIKNLKESVQIYRGKYSKEIIQLIERLTQKLNLAKLDMLNIKQNDELKNFKIKIINDSIEKINDAKSTKAKEKSKLIKSIPDSIGFKT